MIRVPMSPSSELAEVDLELPPEPRSVSEARVAVAALARSLGGPVQAVSLATSEAVGNCVLHAFRGREDGRIQVRAWVEGSALVVRVADDGVGMIPHLDSPGLGLGGSLISQAAREATFESSEEGTTVSMRFDLAAAPASQGAASDE
jgi:anti-sigma regulatory factor (Ser/Thr protein kinase)